jgi:Ran GTPase-activating protein (RanGAP) involved in mRNA processing and transport
MSLNRVLCASFLLIPFLTFGNPFCPKAPLSSVQMKELPFQNLQDRNLPALVACFPNLRYLNLEGNLLTSKGAQYLGYTLPKLRSLNLAQNPLGEKSLKEASKALSHVTDLNISGVFISKEGLRRFGTFFTNLRTLNLAHVSNAWTFFLNFPSPLESLRFVDLTDSGLTANQLSYVVNTLKYVNAFIGDYNDLSDEGLIKISQTLKSLSILKLAGNRIHEKGIAEAFTNLTHLKVLDLSYNRLTDHCSPYFIKYLKNLRKLFLNRVSMSAKHLKALSDEMSLLEFEHLENREDNEERENRENK